MARTKPFDEFPGEYENWFDEHRYVYLSELRAIKHFAPSGKRGVEIGIGTGRFAIPIGIKEGVEPSAKMREYATKKGLKVYDGDAENLPLKDGSYDFALMVTTVCFVDDVSLSFTEVNRILKSGGIFVVGLVDKNSPLGQTYQKIKAQNKFYRIASFFSTDEIMGFLKQCTFNNIEVIQTVFGTIETIDEIQPHKNGYGEGGFVVIKSEKI